MQGLTRNILFGIALLCVTLQTALADEQLDKAIASPLRSAEFAARDRYRHPAETLQFFALNAQDHVAEIWPSLGWYSEILAPYLRDQGKYVAVGFSAKGDKVPQWRKDRIAYLAQKFAAQPQLYDKVSVSALGFPDDMQIAAQNSMDKVLTFRNVHNWMKGGYAGQVFDAMYSALKPGGILGLVEHRAKPGTSVEQMISSGYVTEQHAIMLATRAGFKLLARSDINANPRDSADHPAGVWTLPPTLRLGDEQREHYLAIGESDRMTLKFVKP